MIYDACINQIVVSKCHDNGQASVLGLRFDHTGTFKNLPRNDSLYHVNARNYQSLLGNIFELPQSSLA